MTVSTSQIEAQVLGEDKIASNNLLDMNKKKIDLIKKLEEQEEKKQALKSNPAQAAEVTTAAQGP